MAGKDPEHTAQKCDPNWRHSKLRKKLRQLKTDSAIKIKIEDALGLARLVSALQGRNCRFKLFGHSQSGCQSRQALSSAAGASVSARMFNASSRSARVCFAVTQARKQTRLSGTAG